MQAAPAVPQLANALALHAGPLQQPVGQAAALHPPQTPAVQLWAPQLWQAAPPEPQEVAAVPGLQRLFSQHPEHEVGVQLQALAVHSSPVAQFGAQASQVWVAVQLC